MSLRGKVAAFGVGLVLTLVLALFLVARQVLVHGFDRVERQFMQNSVQTFQGHMPFEYFEVASRIRELATWPARIHGALVEPFTTQGRPVRASSHLGIVPGRVGIVMDDFGTGYSSLSYIHTLPLDKIKIDRAFVSNMTEDPTSLEIIRTIIGLARTLGLTVVPEGIERGAAKA